MHIQVCVTLIDLDQCEEMPLACCMSTSYHHKSDMYTRVLNSIVNRIISYFDMLTMQLWSVVI